MGYRSEVAFVTLNLPVPSKFNELLKDYDCDFLYKEFLVDNQVEHPESEVWRAGMMESVKWSSVGIGEEFEQWILDNSKNTYFVRMGEDDGDTDTYGELWDNAFDIGIHRYINVDSVDSDVPEDTQIYGDK